MTTVTATMDVGPGQSVHFRDGAIFAVGEILRELRVESILLVVDRPAFIHSGAQAALADSFEGIRVELFDEFQLNPKLEDIERGVDLFRTLGAQAIVAIGGGSALDVAKLIGACGSQIGPVRKFACGEARIVDAGPPLIAVPTTAGTGSESTHFAVVYVDGSKHSVAHPSMRPAHVVLDPLLTHSLPRGVTVAAGLDALCQAIESIWAVGANDESMAYATEAARLAIENLPICVLEPTAESRREMMKAAHLAGKAINITKTTAPHALSYGITSRYGTPHGVAVAMSLAGVLRFNCDVDETNCADGRGVEHVRSRLTQIIELLGASDIDQACARWESLLRKVGSPTRLSEVGVERDDLESLVSQINSERVANNPRRVDRAAFLDMLTKLY